MKKIVAFFRRWYYRRLLWKIYKGYMNHPSNDLIYHAWDETVRVFNGIHEMEHPNDANNVESQSQPSSSERQKEDKSME